MAKIDSDVTALTANLKNLGERIDRFQNYMEKYILKGDSFRDDATRTLAIIVNNQDDFKDYIKQCNIDRANHEKRLTACEGFQSRLLKFAGAVSAIIAFAMSGLIQWIRH